MNAAEWTALKAAFAELVELGPADRNARLESMDPARAAALRTLLRADDDVDERLEELERKPLVIEEDPLGLCGSSIAQFRIARVLGRGGMGIAYAAEDTRLGRAVALKFLLPQYGDDARARERVMNEARAASALDHPNVCTLLEIADSPHGLYLAMPAYPGETLKERLAREGSLPIDDAIDITRQILRGLAAAHAASIVHRDLKPGNIMLTAGGVVKILDFGLARVGDVHLSAPGTRQGTVAYMSPEQVAGENVDRATDLWSVGVLFYEMVVGRRPFGGGHDLSTIYSILHETPASPSDLRDDVPPHIETVIRRLLSRDDSTRFGSAEEVLAALGAAHTDADRSRPRRTRRRTLIAFVGIGLMLAVVPLVRLLADRSTAPDPPAAVAVLPFVDTSPDQTQAYLGDGVAEEILNVLTQVPELSVPARASSFAFRGSDAQPREIARRLGVNTLLEGSVHRAADRIRIATRLVDARTGRHIWARTFEGNFDDVYTMQSEIATAVAQALRARLRVQPREIASTNAAAIELHLRGLFHFNRRTVHDLQQAIQFFEQSTLLDSTYARSWAGLAMTYVALALLDPSRVRLLERVDAAAARALTLDPQLAEAHAARGYAYHWQWRWDDAERELHRATTLNPRLSTAQQWYGEHLAKMGRFDEGEARMRNAIALDPLSLIARNDLGIVLLLARRYPEAISQFQDVLRTDPAFPLPNVLLHRVYMLQGNAEEAARAGRRWADLTNLVDGDDIELIARATRDSSLRQNALTVLRTWEQRATPGRWPDIAMYYTLLEDNESAVRALQHAAAARAPMMAQVKVVQWLDPLRSDPRVQSILRSMAFPDP